MTRACEICRAPIKAAPSSVARGQGRFCSRQCRNKYRWNNYHATIEKWFWKRVDKTAGQSKCWPWTGRRLRAGYGRLVLHGKQENAHRIAFTLTTGAPARGLFVCHHCDNPPCCNPAHLYAGTHQDNVNDKMRRGRARGRYSALRAIASQPHKDAGG